jgi:hypothetical protein
LAGGGTSARVRESGWSGFPRAIRAWVDRRQSVLSVRTAGERVRWLTAPPSDQRASLRNAVADLWTGRRRCGGYAVAMAWLDTVHGVIARRVLLNYRIEPRALAAQLPTPFRPKLYRGFGIGGVCMIRFEHLRPRFVPAWLGMRSENAAHRFAVEWDQDGRVCKGVFIPRRDTGSWFNRAFGGRAFPGLFHRSKFEVDEAGDRVSIRIVRRDRGEEISFAGRAADALPASSVFPSLSEAAAFFALGATGYSATRRAGHFHGRELRSLDWTVAPLEVEHARSCFFDDRRRFAPADVALDSALVMRGIEHEWHSRPELGAAADGSATTEAR